MTSTSDRLLKTAACLTGDKEIFVSDISPEKNLLIGVVERAILDLNSKDKRTKHNAIQWMFGSMETTPMSFLWICLELDWNPIIIRAGVEKMHITGHKDLYCGLNFKRTRNNS